MMLRRAILIAAMVAASSAAFGETWSCERPYMGEKTEKMKWVVSGDQIRAFTAATPKTGAKKFYRIMKNDSRVLVAFYKIWPERRTDSGSILYVIIDKTSGILIEVNDIALNVAGEEWAKDNPLASPEVEIGHCVQTAP
jgi:hypothetical protein